MLRKSVVLFALAAFTTTGCTKNADNIAAAYISPIAYESYTCQQLAGEMQRVSAKASGLAGVQNRKATNDQIAMGVGLVVFWPALFFLSGGNSETAAELARLKGSLDALEQAGIKKNCGIQIQRPPPPPRVASKRQNWDITE